MKRKRTYARQTREALSVLGKLIRIGRMERGMTAQELADRVGISRTTLHNIEKGAPGPEIGTVFEAAALSGVRLFDQDDTALRTENARLAEKLTLLPKSVRLGIGADTHQVGKPHRMAEPCHKVQHVQCLCHGSIATAACHPIPPSLQRPLDKT